MMHISHVIPLFAVVQLAAAVPTYEDTPTAAFAIHEALAAAFLAVAIFAAIALFGRWHSRVLLVRWYWGVLLAGMISRTAKLSVPQMAFYRTLADPPVVNSASWWMAMGEWLLYIGGNAALIVCYALILRMWHNALNIVAYSGSSPQWPQSVLLYVAVLSIMTDVVLTVMLTFVTPDAINVANAFKDCATAIILSVAFVGYWWYLRKSLRQIAAMGGGRAVNADASISERALKKLRRISWVSMVCTVGSLYRACSMLRFALITVRVVVHPAGEDETDVAIERIFFFVLSEIVPALSMLVIMLKFSESNDTPARGQRKRMQLETQGDNSRASRSKPYGFTQLA